MVKRVSQQWKLFHPYLEDHPKDFGNPGKGDISYWSTRVYWLNTKADLFGNRNWNQICKIFFDNHWYRSRSVWCWLYQLDKWNNINLLKGSLNLYLLNSTHLNIKWIQSWHSWRIIIFLWKIAESDRKISRFSSKNQSKMWICYHE